MTPRSSVFLAAACVVGAAAVFSPLDGLADGSFAWHMVQHLVLFFVVPLLVLVAEPFDIVRRAIGKARTVRLVRATRWLHSAAGPGVALAAYVATIWLTHFSPLYELALERPGVHVAEHALYLAAGTLFWIPVLGTRPVRPLSYPARLLYLIVALPQGSLVAAAITGAPAPLYVHYAGLLGATRALADQRDAAAVLWIGGGLVILCALLVTAAVWAARESATANERTLPRRVPGRA